MRVSWTLQAIHQQFRITPTQIKEFVRKGLLRPRGWEEKTDVEKKRDLAESSLEFSGFEVDEFVHYLARQALQSRNNERQFESLQERLDLIEESQASILSFLDDSMRPMSLQDVAKALEFSVSNMHRLMKKDGDRAVFQIPGFRLSFVKCGRSWKTSKMQFWSQWRTKYHDVELAIKKRRRERLAAE